MPSEELDIIDPRRIMHVQGFSGRAATATLHDASETGFQISGIFQAAEDFANVQLFSAYDYFKSSAPEAAPRDGSLRADAPVRLGDPACQRRGGQRPAGLRALRLGRVGRAHSRSLPEPGISTKSL